MRCQFWIVLIVVLTSSVVWGGQESTSALLESDFPVSTVSTGIDNLSSTSLAQTSQLDLALSLKRFQQNTISALNDIWTALPSWKTTLSSYSTSIVNTSTSIITTSPSALLLALTTGIELVQQLSRPIIDYCVRTKYYLDAANEYEEIFRKKSTSDSFKQQRSDISVPLLTPRQRQEAIGKIAGLQPAEIPQLAILLERANRKIEKWNGDLWSRIENAWRSVTYWYRLWWMAAAFSIGVVVFADGRTLRFIAWLGILMILWKIKEISAWFEAV